LPKKKSREKKRVKENRSSAVPITSWGGKKGAERDMVGLWEGGGKLRTRPSGGVDHDLHGLL